MTLTTKLFLSLLMLASFIAQAADDEDYAFVQVDTRARVRSDATVHSDLVGKLDNGTRVKITGPMHGNWVPVQYDEGKTGFIYKDLLVDSRSGKTLDKATEAGLIDKSCVNGSCEPRPSAAQKNTEDLQEVARKVPLPPRRPRKPAPEPVQEDEEESPPQKVGQAVGKMVKDIVSAPFTLINKLAFSDKLRSITERQALMGRYVAPHAGSGYRSGNKSKGWCAMAVKQDLLQSGLCKTYPKGHAVDLARSLNSCPGLKKTSSLDINNVKTPAVIVYRTTRHQFGHTEMVEKLTKEMAIKLKISIKYVGRNVYCSDFCRPSPTISHGTNTPIAIFQTRTTDI